MNKKEKQVIANIIERLHSKNLGCSNGFGTEQVVTEANEKGIECASRLYIDTWIIPALEILLIEDKNVDDLPLAVRLSSKR